MRVDKFLKLSRLVKRRTVAQEMAEVGAVRVNRKKVKSSADVFTGDLVEIAYPRRILTVRVVNSDETALKRGASAYEFVEEKKTDNDNFSWQDV